jgi:hypothetical protein
MPPADDGGTSAKGDLATILYRLDTIEKKFDRWADEQDRRMSKFTDDHEARIRELEETTTRLSERMTLWQAAQATFTIVASALAAFIGRQP